MNVVKVVKPSIDYTKIIILIIVIGGFIVGLIFLRNKLNKNCSQGEIYDNKLGCIKDCSSQPNTYYSSESKTCISNCVSPQQDCGGTCYSTQANQQCLQDGTSSYICQADQLLCSGSNGQCYNQNSQTCINGQIYSTNLVCNATALSGLNPPAPVICDGITTQCNILTQTCFPCPQGQKLCNGICCAPNSFCDTSNNGNCSTCAVNQTVCGRNCCQAGYICDSHTDTCIQCATSLCSYFNPETQKNKSDCLDVGQSCTNDGPCNSLNIYQQGNSSYCCTNGLCNGICCGVGQVCENGKCMTACGTTFCDPSTEACYTDKYNNKSCFHPDCKWGQIHYNPEPIPYGNNQQLEVCSVTTDGATSLWATQNPNATLSAYDSQVSIIPCNETDCKKRSAEGGLQNLSYDGVNCNYNIDCNSKPLLSTFLTCPLENVASCCTDGNGSFTGQVCSGGEICIDNVCSLPTYGYYCQKDGTCKEGLSNNNPNAFNTQAECTSACYKETNYKTIKPFCPTGSPLIQPILNEGCLESCDKATNPFNDNYRYKCSFDESTNSCNCKGTSTFTKYQDI